MQLLTCPEMVVITFLAYMVTAFCDVLASLAIGLKIGWFRFGA